MSSAGMCWWLAFIKTFICASCAAITGRGCGWINQFVTWAKSQCEGSRAGSGDSSGVFSSISFTACSFRQKPEGILFFLMLDFTCSSFGWRRLQMCVTHWRHRLTQHWCHHSVEGFILYSWELETWLLVFSWSVQLDNLKWVLHACF